MRPSIIVLGIIVVMLGTDISAQVANGQSKSGAVIPADLQAAIADIPLIQPYPKEAEIPGSTWEQQMVFLKTRHPDKAPLISALIAALDGIDHDRIRALRGDFNKTRTEGWQSASSGVKDCLNDYRPLIDGILQEMHRSPVPLPPSISADTKSPEYLRLVSVMRLLNAKSRELAATDPAKALDTSLAISSFWLSFCERDASMVSHLIGINCISGMMGSIEGILRDPRLTEKQAADAAARLVRFDQEWAGAERAVLASSREILGSIRKIIQDPSSFERGGRQSNRQPVPKLQDILKGITYEDIEREIEPYLRAQSLYYSRPAIQRTPTSPPGPQSSNVLIRILEPDYTEYTIRQDTVRSMVRLNQALARERAIPSGDLASIPTDPFTSQPLQFSASAFWSVGADLQDDKGLVIYDPTNGTASQGDIVVQRFSKSPK